MALSLDGNTSFIGTEFIKLLNTGSSDLATEEYVLEQVALGGGSGDGYTQAEVDALLNNKLNVNNPQDILGTLRIDSANGNGKLIVNAVGAPNDEDFYVNGLSNLGGTLKCQLLQASSNIETSQLIKSNTINTFANVNMTIQRNSIDYIVLESDKVNFTKDIYVNDVLLTGGGDGTFDENVVINNPYELQCNTFNNSVLNQDVVFNLNSNEWLRLQFSDNTVRVPNTKSFLSQNIYTDIIRPIAFGNDMVCYGSNAADSGYVEYWKLNHSAETIDFSKVIRCNELNTLTDTDLIIKRYGVEKMSVRSTYTEFSGGVHCGNQLVVDTSKLLTLAPYAFGGYNYFDIRNNHGTNPMIRFRCSVSGETVCMEITPSYVNLKKDLTIENTVRLKTNTIDTNDDNDLVLKRNDVQFLALDKFTENSTEKEAIICSKQLRANGNMLVKNLQINQFPVGVEYCDFRLENADSVMRFYAGNSTSVNLQITNNELTLGRVVNCNGGLKTNVIDTLTDTDLIFKRNDVQHMLFSSGKVEMTQPCHFNGSWVLDTADLISCSYRVKGALRICDFRNNHTAGTPAYRFMCGGGTGSDVILYITSTSIDTSRDVNIGSSYSLKSNAINSNGDNDNSFQRNGVEFFKFQSSVGVDNNDIINVAEGKGISAQHVYGNLFKSRSLGFDTIFYGSNTGATARVEYMRYNYAGESLDFNTVIDNTGLQVIGNIVDTTVSDERLKTNIEDVECNFTECVKNVKVKTFEYTDEKYKKNDRYGFIAQELLENLPKEFNHIVKENKEKDSDDKYLSINYMKVNLLLWGCCQEQQSKIEHLESRLFELEDIVKEMRGKGKEEKPKPKSKAKAKSKLNI